MRQLGKAAPRSLQSFGVAGVLQEEALVFYNTLFNTRNLGRVIDLFAARLQKTKLDELKLRQILTLEVFEAYRAQIGEAVKRKQDELRKAAEKAAAEGKAFEPKEEEDRLDDPITLECGIDDEKLAIGVSMTLPNSFVFDPRGLERATHSKASEDPLARILIQLQDHADRLVIRFQAPTRRLEIISLLALPDQVDASQLAGKDLATFVDVPPAVQEEAAGRKYEELGDSDYAKLLASDTRLKGAKKKGAAGSAIAAKMAEFADGDSRVTAGPGEDDEAVKLRALEQAPEGSESVEGDEDEAGSNTTVKGKKGKGADKSSITFEGGEEEDGDDTETTVESDSVARSVKKKSVKGKQQIEEDVETEVESDKIKKAGNKITFKGGDEEEEEEEEELRIAGGAVKKKKVKKIKFVEGKEIEEEEEEEIVVEGQAKKKEREQVITFAADEIEEEAEGEGGGKKIIRRRRVSQSGTEGDDTVEEIVEAVPAAKRLRKLIRRVWPFGDKEEEGSEDQEVQGGEGEVRRFKSEKKDQYDNTKIVFKADKKDEKKEKDYTLKSSTEEEGKDEKDGKKEGAKGDGPQALSAEKDGSEGSSEDGEKSAEEKEKDGDSQSKEDGEDTEDIVEDLKEQVLNKTVDKIQKEAMELKKVVKDEKTKRWVDNLTRDLIAEKSNLRDTAKRISQSVRQKELEFKNKSSQLEEKIRKSDEALAQKSTALNRAREQLAQMTRSIDRMKQAAQDAGEVATLKQKYQLSQKVLQSSKEENLQLQQKLDDARAQVNKLQVSGGNRGPSQTEYAVLQNKYERTFKQVDDMKRINQQLTAQLADRRSLGASQNTDEIKKKLEISTRQFAVSKKENELLQVRIARMQKDERFTKAELLRLQEALKVAQQEASLAKASARINLGRAEASASAANPTGMGVPPKKPGFPGGGSSGTSGGGTKGGGSTAA